MADEQSRPNRSPDPDAKTVLDSDAPKIDTPTYPMPESIGNYRIIRPIGEGGMGAVYEAEQDSPRRTVALKVIRAGVASPNLLRRFEHEAQILGKLDHPGIATIFEAGTFDAGAGPQPFFAMELVRGQPLTNYANDKKLGTRQRLELLARIANAVQHAHQKGVIHRDLKPGNILVTDDDQVKILDFGVARATDADVQTSTMQTDIGQLVGTVPYMSPEQAAGDPDELDTRSDVYALGVVAYELLAGRLPYEIEEKMIHEAVRVIREDDPTPLSSFNRVFRGDIEIIIGKALQKEKDRRYQSASDFASDIHRYLSDEPIVARPPSRWYQLSKFSKRNKALVGGVAAVLVVSVIGSIVSISFAASEAEQKRAAIQSAQDARDAQALAEQREQEAETARTEETKRAEELQLVADFQAKQLSDIDPELMGIRLNKALIDAAPEGQQEQVRLSLTGINFTNIALGTLTDNIFERTINAINEQFADQPLVQAQLLQTVADTLRDLGILSLATDSQQKAMDIRRSELGSDHSSTLTSINNMGWLLYVQGNLDEAEPYWREALEGNRRTLGDDDPHTLNSIGNMGLLLKMQGKYTEAEPYYRRALEGHRQHLGNDHERTLRFINNMGMLLRAQGKLDEAEKYIREVLEGCRRVLGEEHPGTLSSISNMGNLLEEQGKLDEAETYYREVLDRKRRILGDDHPSTLTSIHNMGSLLSAQGKLEEAETYYHESLEGSRRALGDDHPDTLVSISNMGILLTKQGKEEEAEPYYREALERSRLKLGNDHPDTLGSINNMGGLMRAMGQLGQANALGAEAVVRGREALPPGHWMVGMFLSQHARTLMKMERYDESEKLALESHAIYVNSLGASHRRTIGVTKQLMDFYTAWHTAEPDNGYDAKAAEWQGKLSGPDDEEGASPETESQSDTDDDG